MATDSANYLSKLHQLLNHYFTLEEIRTLCFDLNVDYESVAGQEKPSRIRELLLALGRNGRLPELITIAQQQRPLVDWPPVPEEFELPESLALGQAAPINQYHIYGDVVQRDNVSGDKIEGDKISLGDISNADGIAIGSKASVNLQKTIQTQTYIEKQVIVTGIEITDIEDLPPEPCVPPCVSPYQGLPNFEVNDYERFFGRETLTAQLVNRLHDTRFLAVVGASGSGKSSVVRAGLVPTMLGRRQLEDGTEPPLGEWQVLIMTPTAQPLTRLAVTLFPDDKAAQSELYDQMAKSKSTTALATAVADLAPHGSGRKLLLVVDQFEELFTLCKETNQKQLLVDNLLTAAEQLTQARIIVTLRADFYDQTIQLEGLEVKLEQQQAIVVQMQPEELATLLDLDWQTRLSTSHFPTPAEWEDIFAPALRTVRSQLLNQSDRTRVQINCQLPLPAAFAMGFFFNMRIARVGVWARKAEASDFKQQFWLSDGDPADVTFVPEWIKHPGGSSQTAVVELTSYVTIHKAIEAFVKEADILPGAWLRMRIDREGKTVSNIEESHAVAYANQVGQVLRHLNEQGITDTHLFARIPSPLAVLIGQRLQACGRIHLYWFDNPTYRFAFSLM